MTSKKFWGMQMDDQDEDFDYGRDFLKDHNYDEVLQRKQMPYDLMPLFLYPDWYAGETQKEKIQVGGILRSGHASGAYLKAKICVHDGSEGEESDESHDSSDDDDGDRASPAKKGKEKDEGDDGQEDDEGGGTKKNDIDKKMERV